MPADRPTAATTLNASSIWRNRAGGLLSRDRTLYTLASILAVAVVGLAAWIVVDDRRETRLHTETALANLANALEKDVARNIEVYDIAIQETAEALSLPGLLDANPELRQAALFSRIASTDVMGSMLVIDPAGDVTFDSDGGAPRRGNLADRDYFRIPRDQLDTQLYIGAPLLGREGHGDTIVLSRRIAGPDGSFAGVVAGAVELEYFRNLFARFELGATGAVALLRTDGTLITRFPPTAGDVGRNVTGTYPFTSMLGQDAGIVTGVSALDGVERIFAFRRVGTLPLLITTSIAREEVFAGWYRKSAFIVGAILVLVSLAATLFVALRRQLVHRADAESRALAAADLARRSERNLALAFERLDILFQQSPDAQFAASRRQDGRLAYDLINRRAEDFTGLDSTSMVGCTPEECLPKPIAIGVLGNWERCIAQGEPLSYEMTDTLPSGLRSWETLLVPVRDTDGVIYRIIGTTRDVTQRKQMEVSLLRLNSTLEQRAAEASAAHDDALVRASTAERLQILGQLASGMAHDFNNVLQNVTGCAAMVERRADEPQAIRRAARLITDAAARGSSITNRLLAFSRSTPETAAAPESLALAPVLAEIAEILRHTLRGSAHIDIRIQVDDDDLVVRAELSQLQTVLLNLATNARDAMPDGGTLTLGATAAAAADAGDFVRLWVRDDGTGMDEATLARVTEPFFTTKPVGQGTGLGLSMASAYAEEVGGRLTIDSRPGLGTTVTLWLRR